MVIGKKAGEFLLAWVYAVNYYDTQKVVVTEANQT